MKRILIIGGSRGIGKQILETQSKLHHCINISRSKPEGITSSFEHHSIDVTVDDIPKFEQLDALIYCPGTIKLKPISSLKEEDFLHDFNVNVLGAVKCIKANLRALKKSANGSILMFSSVAAIKGMSFHSSIATSKAGIEGLSRSLAAELAPKIRVNCIAPG
ncbi:MAG: 3-oxoacyl-[acyl-carrier protein] reductase, partial [Maribacter sp.]